MGGRALLAWNLRLLRTARGLSQEQLAVDAGVSRGWVSRLELQKGNTSLDLLDRLAAALGVPITALWSNPNRVLKLPSRCETAASLGTASPAELQGAR